MTEAMNLPDVQAMIDRESRPAMGMGLQAIPFVLVNGKHLGRWKAGYENIIPRILAAAAAEKAAVKAPTDPQR
jgi:alkyl hydroperoxide reductase subunit AhpF